MFDRKGSGDGGRFARRGSFTARGQKRNTTLQDLFDFISQGLNKFNADEDDDDFEDGLFSDANTSEEEEEESEEEEEEEEVTGIHLDWDFAELAELF
ncbi:hypothetical protein ACSSS7_002022 [Eimeria intestinalis]